MPAMLHNGDGAICVYVPAGRLHRALLEMQVERGTVISFMGGEQVYIVVNEQPEEIIKPNS
jgi:hypothetical protein